MSVGVGVGLVLLRAERERRAAALRRRRKPALLPGEPAAAGLRRVMLEQLDRAIELLEGPPGYPQDQTVHETRKTIKRLRALLALLRAELDPKRFARENAALRDCGRRLAGARDAEVMVGTLDALVRRYPEKLAGRRGVRELRAQLIAERERAGDSQSRRAGHRVIAVELRGVRERVAAWELPERPGRRPAKLLGSGLEDIYRRGRDGRRRAARSRPPRALDIELHAWRKRVKDLRYVAETLDRGDRGKVAERARRVARRADRLGEMLGEEHDLALLAHLIGDRAARFSGKHAQSARRTRKTLLKLIARRRKRLRRRALREGERLYRRKPRPFARRLLAPA